LQQSRIDGILAGAILEHVAFKAFDPKPESLGLNEPADAGWASLLAGMAS